MVSHSSVMRCLQHFHAGSRSFTSPRMNLWLPKTVLVARDAHLFLQFFSLAVVPALAQALDVGCPSPLPHGCGGSRRWSKTGRARRARAGSCFLQDLQMLIGRPGF